MARPRRKGVQLLGIKEVMNNLTKEVRLIKNRSIAGMIQAAVIVRRDMDQTPPLIPIDTGGLRSSWSTTSGYVGQDPYVTMGFTANYALFVHEAVGKRFKRPGSGAKFFESSVKRNKGKMLAAIAKEANKRPKKSRSSGFLI